MLFKREAPSNKKQELNFQNTTHSMPFVLCITCNLRKVLWRIFEILGREDENVRLPGLWAKNDQLVEKLVVLEKLK